MMTKTVAAILVATSLAAPTGPARATELTAGVAQTVLLDGRCEAAEWARAARLDLGSGASLLVQEDADHVFVCVRGPAGGLNTLDLYLVTDRAPVPVDLHVSAQVGERTLTQSGWPDWQWRNQTGWYGTPVPFAGMTDLEGAPRPAFARDTDRELQLSKARFGPLPWRIRVDVQVMGPERKASALYPPESTAETPVNWLIVKPSAPRRAR
ncbi:MAG: hypothetical protein JWM77_3467 [Rhodospirillales bacterium]|jgi:hypothetical protein|nr:hypothetical protein [Rhodospirillales bacterium]